MRTPAFSAAEMLLPKGSTFIGQTFYGSIGYTIERVIVDRPYNDIQPWRYHKLMDVFGGGLGLDVHTEGELEVALRQAAAAKGLVFVEIHTGRMDCPESLRSAGRSKAKTNQLE